MSEYLKSFELFFIELPGRGRRGSEELIDDFDVAAADVYEQIRRVITDDNFMLYGHSMGAYLALRVCKMLEMDGFTAKHLFVSGNAGPGEFRGRKRFELADDEFIEELLCLGGTPVELINSEEFVDFFLPIIRADFRVAELHRFEEGLSVRSPVFAMMGSDELEVARIDNWQKFTCDEFDFQIFPGGHFFIYDNANSICQIIASKND